MTTTTDALKKALADFIEKYGESFPQLKTDYTDGEIMREARRLCEIDDEADDLSREEVEEGARAGVRSFEMRYIADALTSVRDDLGLDTEDVDTISSIGDYAYESSLDEWKDVSEMCEAMREACEIELEDTEAAR